MTWVAPRLTTEQSARAIEYEAQLRDILAAHTGAPLPVMEAAETKRDGHITRYEIWGEGNQQLGVASVLVDSHNGRDHFSNVTMTAPKQAHGSAVYLLMISRALARGHDYVQDPSGLKNGSLGVWRRLARAGIAEQLTPTPPGAESRDTNARFLGDFIVRSTVLHTQVGLDIQRVGVGGGLAEHGFEAA